MNLVVEATNRTTLSNAQQPGPDIQRVRFWEGPLSMFCLWQPFLTPFEESGALRLGRFDFWEVKGR